MVDYLCAKGNSRPAKCPGLVHRNVALQIGHFFRRAEKKPLVFQGSVSAATSGQPPLTSRAGPVRYGSARFVPGMSCRGAGARLLVARVRRLASSALRLRVSFLLAVIPGAVATAIG